MKEEINGPVLPIINVNSVKLRQKPVFRIVVMAKNH